VERVERRALSVERRVERKKKIIKPVIQAKKSRFEISNRDFFACIYYTL